MKASLSLAFIVIAALVACSSALPAKKRMVYYQQPAQWYSGPQRMMYVQYVQPGRTHARSTQAASALVAGETVATGTYLQEADVAAAGPSVNVAAVDEQQQVEDVLGAAGAHGAHSVAEAYPEEEKPTADEEIAPEPAVSQDDAKVPRDYNFAQEEETSAGAPVAVDVAADLPAPAPIAPVAKPARRYLPSKKKVYVELEHASAESDDDVAEEEAENAIAVAQDAEEVEEDDEEAEVAVTPPKSPARKPSVVRRPAAKKPSKPVKAAPACAGCAKAAATKPPLPAGTFFPIDFGGTSGGAIAIANSFSTGEGGSATSHAIAYGSPEAARARIRPSKRH